MRIVTLASGSKGNCTLLQTDKTAVLLDAGISLRSIEEKLLEVGVKASEIKAIIITHEHSDHIKSAGAFARKYGVPIIANNSEWKVLEKKVGNVKFGLMKDFFNESFEIDDLGVNAISVPHDSYTCFAYSFFNNGHKISVATDLGIATDGIKNKLKDSSLLILEANHDIETLHRNPNYPQDLKNRILSNRGHLNNIDSARIIRDVMGENLQQVVLAHLSEENNTPLLAYTSVKKELQNYGIVEGKHIFIDVSTQHKVGHVFNLKSKKSN